MSFRNGVVPHVLVAQLDRASASGAEGFRFESCRGYFSELIFKFFAVQSRLLSNMTSYSGHLGDPSVCRGE